MLEEANPVTRARPSILVVEDERVVALDLSGTLKDLGYHVAGLAARADDAIQRAAELKPDLVISMDCARTAWKYRWRSACRRSSSNRARSS